MAEMLEVIIFALEIMHEESSQLGLETNWNKTKIQALNHFRVPRQWSQSLVIKWRW